MFNYYRCTFEEQSSKSASRSQEPDVYQDIIINQKSSDDHHSQPIHREKKSSKGHRNEDKYTTLKSSSNSHKPWLFPNIRVRLIDQKFKKGKYYNQKMVIVDVVTPEVCVCRTENGRLLEGTYDL